MHFFYVDESGDTGKDLSNPDQPVMVLGGVSLRDEGWNRTRREFEQLLEGFFGHAPAADFELHAYELLTDGGAGPFERMDIKRRAGLAKQVLQLVVDRKHATHFIGFDKKKIASTPCGMSLAFNPSRPYLLGFDYLITWINWYVKHRLGRSARGLLIVDEKRQHHDDMEQILYNRRREGPKTHRVKWIVEASYPIDSERNPMVQISDLVVYCVRRFLEIEHGYRPRWSAQARQFYAECYAMISDRCPKTSPVDRPGPKMKRLSEYISDVSVAPVGQWRKRYGL